MADKLFIAGDWGTSNLRLYLFAYRAGQSAKVLDTRFGPGISQLNGDFESVFFHLCDDWFEQHGAIPVILSGMVGSNIGWKEVPYITCPVSAKDISNGRLSFIARDINFSILPGLKTVNPLNLVDVMRGEELQLLGWQLLNIDYKGSRLFALPGTHNKWSLLEENTISNFLSAFTGELFALLKQHSILLANDLEANESEFHEETFSQGVEAAQNLDEASLLHALFSVRSRQVLGEIPAKCGASYLSGLIIAADVIGAYAQFNSKSIDNLSVTVIGESQLSKNYLLVLEHMGIEADWVAPPEIANAGFSSIYKSIYEEQ